MNHYQQGFIDKCAQHGVNPQQLIKSADFLDDIKYNWQSLDPETRNNLIGVLGGAALGGIGGGVYDGLRGAGLGAAGGGLLGYLGADLMEHYENKRISKEDAIAYIGELNLTRNTPKFVGDAPKTPEDMYEVMTSAKEVVDGPFSQYLLGEQGPAASSFAHSGNSYRNLNNLNEALNVADLGERFNGHSGDMGISEEQREEALSRLLRNRPGGSI